MEDVKKVINKFSKKITKSKSIYDLIKINEELLSLKKELIKTNDINSKKILTIIPNLNWSIRIKQKNIHNGITTI